MKTKILLPLLALIVCACAKEVVDEEGEQATANSLLKVVTRAGDAETVAYPVNVYVMNASNSCVAMQKLEGNEEELSILLTAGNYHVYAIGGADESRYTIPTKEQASKTWEIKLNTGKVPQDLMTGNASLELTEGSTNQLALGLERKVMMLKSVTIKQVPSAVTGVQVRLSPLRESVLLDGTFSGEEGTQSVTLTKEDGTWTTTQDTYALPSVGKPTISISLTTEEGVKTYSYTCAEELAENHQVTIVGTYTEAQEVTLTGTITGPTWGEAKTINFNFDEENLTTNTTPPTGGGGSADVPAVGTLYQGCYVLAVNGNTATVLSAIEKDDIVNSHADGDGEEKIGAALATWSVTGVSATWRLPTKAEAQNIQSKYSDINSKVATTVKASTKYFCRNESGIIKDFVPSNAGVWTTTISYNDNTVLRPVADISF